MPRRYADYPDCFIAYNKLSSLGSFLTVLRVGLFVLILWDSMASQRGVMFVQAPSSNLE